MRTLPAYITAAVLAVSGATFIGCDRDQSASTSTTSTNTNGGTTTSTDTRTTGEKVGDKLDTAADKTKDVAKRAGEGVTDAAQTAGSSIKNTVGGFTGANANRVPNLISNVTEAALTKDGLDDVVERFVDADRNRIGKSDLNSGNDQLNNLVASIAADWKAKYNTDFDVHDEDKVFSSQFMTAMTGEIPKGAAGAEVKVDTDRKLGGGTETKVDVDRKSGIDSPTSPSADTNRNDPGRNIASVAIPASHGAPALTVPLIHEASGWKIDVPDTLDGAKLRSNLIAHLTEVQNMKAQWPSDVNEGYRAVAHHVLMAIMDRPAK
jgi:hypothetical protein